MTQDKCSMFFQLHSNAFSDILFAKLINDPDCDYNVL